MMQTFDTDNIIYDLLKGSALNTEITGDIFTGERPDDSLKEDVVINTITTSQDLSPQKAVSNVNIYVSDIDVKISGKNQKKANRKRLKELSEITSAILRSAKIEGLLILITNQATINEPGANQHFVNLRIEWNIH